LHQLHAAGCFTQAHAVLFGDFNTNSQQNTAQSFQDRIDAVLREFALNLSIPVLRICGVGHGSKNQPVPLNTATQLILGAAPAMIVAAGCSPMHADAKSKHVANNQVVL
jgi:muramoyltetrapeptide carboxypeptidase